MQVYSFTPKLNINCHATHVMLPKSMKTALLLFFNSTCDS